MGFFSSVCSSLGSFFSSSVSALGSAISGFCTSVIPIISNVLTKVDQWKCVGDIIANVAKIIGIWTPDDQIEDIGDRAIQACEVGIVPERYDRFEEYMDAIKKFQLDPEKTKVNLADDKIVGAISIGMGIAVTHIEDKFNLAQGSVGDLVTLVAAKPEYFTGDRISSILTVTKDVRFVVEYFNDKLDSADSRIAEAMIINASQKIEPEKNIDEIKFDIVKAQESITKND